MLRASRHREVDDKSNEITAVPELLDTLHLDVMGCQKFPDIWVLGELLKDQIHGNPRAGNDRLTCQDLGIGGDVSL